jgi:subtilisin family serine protease
MKPVSGRHPSLSVGVSGQVAAAVCGPYSSLHGLAASPGQGRVPCLESREGTVTVPDGTKKDELQPGDTQTDGKNRGMDQDVFDQAEYIKNELTDYQVDYVPLLNGMDFMYATGQILVLEEYVARVQTRLGLPADGDGKPATTEVAGSRAEPIRTVEPVVPGVVLLRLGEKISVTDALGIVEDEFGEDIATPDHVLTVAGSGPIGGPCPATEPLPAYYETEPFPGICTQNSGAGVLVYITDTGLLKNAAKEHFWLDGVERARKRNGQFQAWEDRVQTYQGRDVIAPYAGHGTFVAGVVRCMAPQAEVIVSKVFKKAGSGLESNFVRDLYRALSLGVDVFNLTVACTSRRDRPLLAFGAWLRVLARYKGTVCVVAAGNNNSRRPHWPAAFAGMVSVGALGTGLRDRARFSNYGGWVDVYAPGRDLVNAYTDGTYVCRNWPYRGEERKFHGMARWSGTSFSTPIVSGLVAARMSRTGESGQEAAAALLAEARSQAIPGVGAILLPCCGGAAPPAECDCGCHRRQCAC